MSKKSTEIVLSADQKEALEVLDTDDSVFLTGEAGSGKSYVIRQFLRGKDQKMYPSLASTGAAAVLVGGRTFHSFMGLGILEGGRAGVLAKAMKDKRLHKRLQQAHGFVLDEVSMLSGETLDIAEEICRTVRDSDLPWGGLRVVAVGDFAQLPPVEKYSREKNWAFEHPIWSRSSFLTIGLRQNMRTQDQEFLSVLNDIRAGEASERVKYFLESRKVEDSEHLVGTRLYPRRAQADQHNMSQLALIDHEHFELKTDYGGSDDAVRRIKEMAPIPEVLHLKIGAYVMLRMNDPKGRFVNGSTGFLKERSDGNLLIELMSGRQVAIEKMTFQMLNAEGTPIAIATNFPISLAYAVTIHKAQGLTVDQAIVDLRRLWEPGHAYVAVSRVKLGQNLFVEGWEASSIRSDAKVQKFYDDLRGPF
jgi:ATP-dependent DNA helicase PIF1